MCWMSRRSGETECSGIRGRYAAMANSGDADGGESNRELHSQERNAFF